MLPILTFLIFMNTAPMCEIPIEKDNYALVEVVHKRAHTLQTLIAPQDPIDIVRAAEEASHKFEIDVALVFAIIEIESRYSKKAKSKKGCMGLTQVSKSTGKYMANKLGIVNYSPFNIKHNLLTGIGYLKELLDQYKDLKKAITIYNKGIVNYLDNPTISRYAHGVVKRYRYLKSMIKKENDLSCK